MDEKKRFGKTYEQIDWLVQIVHTFSIDIGMEFGIKKCGVLVLKRGKIAKMEGVLLPDGGIHNYDLHDAILPANVIMIVFLRG